MPSREAVRKLSSFNFITLNGFTHSLDGDISWHRHGDEEHDFSVKSLMPGNILLFGRKTYELMASYWPTRQAVETDPEVANRMNEAEKLVFSRTLKAVDWKNTGLVKGNIVEVIRHLKDTPGKDLTILGSGEIVTLFAETGLIDEFQIMLDPIAIGSGVPIFNNLKSKLDLTLADTKVFKSGVILLSYNANRM